MNADLLARGYSAFLNFLAEPALRSLLLGCVAALALAAFRVQRVRARLLVWTAVLCAALAMPLLGAFLPRVRVGVPAGWMKSLQTSFQASFQGSPGRAAQHETAASGAVVRSAETAARASSKAFVASGNAVDRSLRREMKIDAGGKAARAKTSEAQVLSAASSREPRRSDTKDAITPVVTTPAAAPSAAPVKSFAIPWTALMLGVYLLGAGILLMRVAIGVWFSARLGRSAQDIEDREALRVLRYRAAFTGLTNAPRLKESAVVAVPATVGVRRAVILLPATWRTWTDEQLDAILAHEVSHVARRDALTQMLSLSHRAIFWFSPLGWWLDRQLTDLAEQASDEAALAGGADRQRYAKTLVGFFEQLGATPGRVWWQGVSMAKASKIGSAERRVGRILAWRGGMSMKKSFAVALLTIAAPIIFVAASVHPFIARAQDKPPAPPQNVMQPGGPVAPVLPNAPKGGVVAPPAMGTPPAMAPALPNAPVGPRRLIPPQGPTPSADGIPGLTVAQAAEVETEIQRASGVAIRFENVPNVPITITKATVKIVPVQDEFLITPPALSLENNTGKKISRVRVDLNARPMFEDTARLNVEIGPHDSYQLQPDWRDWSNIENSVRPNELTTEITGVCFADGSEWGECEDAPPSAILAPNQNYAPQPVPPLAGPGSGYAPAKFINLDDAPVEITQAWTSTGRPSPDANEIGVLGRGPTSYLPVVTLANNSDERVIGLKLRFKAVSEGHAITAVKVSIAPHASYTFKQNSIMQGRPEDMHVQVLGVKFEDGKVWGSMTSQVDAREQWINVEPGSTDEAPDPAPLVASTPRAEIGAGAMAAVAPLAGYEPSTPMAAVAPMPGYAPSTQMAATAPLAPRASIAPAQDQSGNTVINGSYSYGSYSYGGGPRYVIMSGNSNEVNMSGSDEDLDHARELRKKISGDFIWFERDEKSYVITDPGFIAKAKALFAPEDALSKQQDELSRQQDALSKQQDALSNQQDNVKVKVPDISPDIKRIQNELDALRQSGATQSELGRLQSELGQLQSRMGGFQSEAGVKQSEIGQQQGELGRQQGELGRKQGELGRQQGEIARKASMELRHMFDEAIANGTAKPE